MGAGHRDAENMERSQNADIEKLEAAYQRIGNAIYDHRLVEHCSIDQDGKAIDWSEWMGPDFRAFHPSRYRIDGKDVWPIEQKRPCPLYARLVGTVEQKIADNCSNRTPRFKGSEIIGEPIKRIDIKEFREFGFLQGANRKFFHPLGLALEIIIDEDGSERLGGIWDYRDDPEGIIYEPGMTEKAKFERVADLRDSKREARCALFGTYIQPTDDDEPEGAK